ncbi:hypothetical protein BDN72DRAFT_438465 [Pluteus cervinus]|uniref:Uncharacterized protein n=1 Tax=Pluteus cervinus TaxID=181527 RepID=A0ACD3A795_9AGAR|nr:hypothetical protein BDN72DRAFT_438465 [Pluteus cervinus]
MPPSYPPSNLRLGPARGSGRSISGPVRMFSSQPSGTTPPFDDDTFEFEPRRNTVQTAPNPPPNPFQSELREAQIENSELLDRIAVLEAQARGTSGSLSSSRSSQPQSSRVRRSPAPFSGPSDEIEEEEEGDSGAESDRYDSETTVEGKLMIKQFKTFGKKYLMLYPMFPPKEATFFKQAAPTKTTTRGCTSPITCAYPTTSQVSQTLLISRP